MVCPLVSQYHAFHLTDFINFNISYTISDFSSKTAILTQTKIIIKVTSTIVHL